MVVVVGFQTDKLSQKQQTQVSLGIRERFSNAGVDNVQVMVPGGSTSPKKTTRNDVVRVNIVDGPLKGDRKVHGVTPNKGDSSKVTTETAPGSGEGLVNFLINVGAHEAGHGTRALPQYDGDGFPLGSILNPEGAEPGTVMEQGASGQTLGSAVREFSDEDAESLRLHLNSER